MTQAHKAAARRRRLPVRDESSGRFVQTVFRRPDAMGGGTRDLRHWLAGVEEDNQPTLVDRILDRLNW